MRASFTAMFRSASSRAFSDSERPLATDNWRAARLSRYVDEDAA